MRVVIDTCIFRQSFWLTSTAFRVLLDGFGSAGHTLFMPRVVHDEILNLYQEEIESKAVAFGKATRDWNQLITKHPEPKAVLDKDSYIVAYREFLDSAIDMQGITILPYPSVSHEDVVKRDLARRKPFTKEGKGYRDTLIWESVLELASDGSNEPVVFITDNSSDFLEDRERIHPDLSADLGGPRITASEVTMFVSLQGFNRQYIEPVLTELDELGRQIEAGSYEPLNLESFVTSQLLNSLEYESGESLSVSFQDIFDTINVSRIDSVERIYDVLVRRMRTNNRYYLIRFKADAVLRLTYTITRSMYDYFPEEAKLAFPVSAEPNHPDLTGSYASTFQLMIALIFDPDTRTVIATDIWDTQMLDTLSDMIAYYRRTVFYSTLIEKASSLGGRSASEWHTLLSGALETFRESIALQAELVSLQKRG